MAHSERRLHEVSTATAQSVLLDHPAVTSDHQTVCKLLQVCKSWRTAVQLSDAALTNIDTTISQRAEDIPKLAHLAAWISTYPSLIRTISISSEPHNCDEQHNVDTNRRMLERGLRLAAAAAAAAGTSKAAEQRATVGAVPLGSGLKLRQRWVLQTFECDLECSPAMLAALPAATLTRLALSCINPKELTAIAASIQGLPSLQELMVNSHKSSSRQPIADHKLLAAVGTLKQLDILYLGGLQDLACLQQLPRQLQQLTVQATPAHNARIDLGHLTSLQRFELQADCVIKSDAVLPAKLTSLRLETYNEDPITTFSITCLQQLQHLTIDRRMSTQQQCEELEALVAMSQLQQLHLTNQDVDPWGDTDYAEVWSHLIMLRSLAVDADCVGPWQLTSLCSSAGQATSLTSLNLQLAATFFALEDHQVKEAASLKLCQCLTNLVQLQDLSIRLSLGKWTGRLSPVFLAQHDLQHLTALTGLTRLHVNAPGGADDTVVCALVGALTRLRSLSLPHYCLSTAPLPNMGLLKGLQHLQLSVYEKSDAEFGLNVLTGLCRLTHLGGFEKAGQDALISFWAAVHG